MSLVTILGLLFVVTLTVFLIGRRLPKTHAAASRMRLPVSRDQLFAVVTDVAAHPQWRPGLAKVELGPDVDGHPTWYEFCTRDIRVQFQVAASEPPARLVTRLVGQQLPLYGTWTYDFVEDDGATVLTITESEKIYSPLLRFFARYVLSYHAAMDIFLFALARKFGVDAHPEHLSIAREDAEPD